MSLVRTILRLTAVEALRPTAALPTVSNPAGGPWPTIARGNVYDARIDTIDDLVVGERAPIISIYADDDNGSSGQTGGGPPFLREIDLSIELSIAQLDVDPENPEEFSPFVPATDAESEASLDLLEASVRYTLIYGPTAFLFRKISRNRIKSIHSQPSRTGEEAIRLAMRTITMTIQVEDDCYNLSPKGDETGLDRLPEPMRSVIKAMPDQSYAQSIAAGLSDYAPTAPVPVAPFSVVAEYNFHRPHTADADVTGTIEPAPPED